MNFTIFAIALLSGSASTQLSAAQTEPAAATQPAKPNSETLAAADRLLDAMDYDRMMQRMTDSMAAQMGPTFKQSLESRVGAEIDDELIKRLMAIQTDFLRERLVEDRNMRHAIALIYARHFTAADLDKLAILYKEPVMQKWTESTPAIMGDMMPLLVRMMDAHRDELREKAESTVKDYFAEKEAGGS